MKNTEVREGAGFHLIAACISKKNNKKITHTTDCANPCGKKQKPGRADKQELTNNHR